MDQTPTAAGQEHDPDVIETVRRTVIRRTCGWCGKGLSPRAQGKGRPRTYCSRSCRQRAYEVRTARERQESAQEAGTARRDDEPVREVIREVVTRTRLLPPAQPPARDPWQREEEPPAPDGRPPRPRELQRLLARTAAAIAQGEYSYSEVDRIMRGVSQVQTAADRYMDAVSTHMGKYVAGGKKKRH